MIKKALVGMLFIGGTILFLVGTIGICIAQPTVEWHKAYGDDIGILIVSQTSDGGYIGAGGYGGDAYIIKTDSKGNKKWSKRVRVDEEGNIILKEDFEGAPQKNLVAFFVKQADDGGYMVIAISGRDDLYFIKIDNRRNMEGYTLLKYGSDSPPSVQQTYDSGYILAGSKKAGSKKEDVLLIKTDSKGNKEWEKTFGSPECDYGWSVYQTSDSGYIIAGHIYDLGQRASLYCLYLIKTDQNGNLDWEKVFENNTIANSVQQTSDGGYIITGNKYSLATDDDVYLMKTDRKGNMQWEKTFRGPHAERGRLILQTPDGGYIIGVRTSAYEPAYILKTNSEGTPEWNMTVERTYKLSSIQQTSDGGYILAAGTNLIKLGPTTSIIPTSISSPTLVHSQTITPTPTPEEGVSGFEAIFAISGLLAIAYILRRCRK